MCCHTIHDFWLKIHSVAPGNLTLLMGLGLKKQIINLNKLRWKSLPWDYINEAFVDVEKSKSYFHLLLGFSEHWTSVVQC